MCAEQTFAWQVLALLFYLRPLFLIPLLILVKHSMLGLTLSQYLPTAVFAVPVQEGVELHEQDPLPFCAPSLGDREEQVHLSVLQGEQEAPPSICKGCED